MELHPGAGDILQLCIGELCAQEDLLHAICGHRALNFQLSFTRKDYIISERAEREAAAALQSALHYTQYDEGGTPWNF